VIFTLSVQEVNVAIAKFTFEKSEQIDKKHSIHGVAPKYHQSRW